MEPNRIYDTRYCKYLMLSYKNNTPYEWQVNQNSLFCIVKNNLPNEYSLHKEVVIRSLKTFSVRKYRFFQEIFSDDNAKFQKINKYYWNSLHTEKRIPHMENNSYFQYGDYVWIIENTTLKILKIPMNFEDTGILINKKARYLQDIKVTCIQTNVHAHNKFLDINTFITNVTVLSLPKSVNVHHLEGCPKNICIPVEARICNDVFEHCQNIRKPYNASTYKPNCNMTGNHGEYSCYNIVKRLRYVIFHNAEKGIVKVEVLFFLSNLKLAGLKTVYVLQEFEVQYAWINVTVKYDLLRSGNPGYIVGKPIIIGQIAKLTDTGKNINKNLIIIRESIDLASNFLVLSQRKADVCVLNNNTNTIIKFGYNTIFTCKMIDFLNVTSATAKRYCQEIQKAIFKLWSIANPYQNITRVYGKYGNADVNKIDEWGNITYTLNPNTLLSNITGNFLLNNSKIDCHHLYNVIKIDIFHARQVVKTLHNQEKIVWLMISFENRHNQSFLMIDNRISLKSQLRSEIMFYDVTTKKNKHYLGPPTFDIKIPDDLFYPFVKVKN
ncbi:hypothetical protein AMK59_5128 [Oryctes borbonicus]|uniref:Uncharacterized protein n=1 Tax=Oryctes borbonicus TaxID=1629725 RepID=A0A0T6B1M8_9SCAR|nr:hypothetical protein AMK59_5128 [Oryctes borbonicus]